MTEPASSDGAARASLQESPHGVPSDAELISQVRGGDVSAYGDLFARHRDAASRLGRQLIPGPDADDLVSEAFTKVLNVLLNGGGPDVAFRAYLLTAVRRLHVDRIRATRKATPTDDLSAHDPGVPFADPTIASFESGAAARAYASLPERWQLVLWHLEVEGNKPADVAPLLGMSANSVSALAYRAREGLRQAFLQMHTADLVGEDCRWTNDHLGGYVRNGLSRRDSHRVSDHLQGCRRCTAIYLELREVNSELAALIGPIVLGTATVGYLVAGAAPGTAGAGVLLGFLGRVKDAVAANSQAAIAAGVVTGVSAVATVAFVVTQGQPVDPRNAPSESGVAQTAPSTTPTPSTKPAEPPVPAVAARIPALTSAPVAPRHQPPHATHKPGSTAVVQPLAAPVAPTPTPAPEPSAPPPKVDVSVTVAVTNPPHHLGTIEISTHGLPAGKTTQLTVTPTNVPFLSISKRRGVGCGWQDPLIRCSIISAGGSSDHGFRASFLPALGGGSLTVAVDAVAGFLDPNLSNNQITVALQ